MNEDGIILQLQEDGTWGIKKEPYCTIEIQTEEDYNKLESLLERDKAKKPIKNREQKIRYTSVYSCPTCNGNFSCTGIANHCYHCGQKLDWEV